MAEISLFKSSTKKIELPKPKNNVEEDSRYGLYKNKPLEELLDDLVKYGKHNVSWMGDGWYCSLEFYVNVIGAKLEVRSDFNNQSHKNAVIQCTIRLHETIDQINKTRN